MPKAGYDNKAHGGWAGESVCRINLVWHTIRPCDMVTVGCLTPEEAAEDIEISLAALEGRPPRLGGRSSPKRPK